MRHGIHEWLAARWQQLLALAFAAAVVATPLLAWAQGTGGSGTGGTTGGGGTGGPPPGGTGAGGPGSAPAGAADGGGTAFAWIIVILAVAVVIWLFSRRRRGTVTR